MVVDERYVERIVEDEESETAFDYNAVLEEFGVEADFVEDASGITVPADYWSRNLNQLPTGGIFAGKPYLGVPEKVEYDVKDDNDKPTGEKDVKYRVKFVVIDDPSKEAYIININLNSLDNIHKDLVPASKLYALQMGLMELKAPGIACTYNRLTVNLDNLRKVLDSMEDIYFKVVEMDGGSFKYKSFVIVSEDTLE